MAEGVLVELFSWFKCFLEETGLGSEVVSFSFNQDKLKEVAISVQSILISVKTFNNLAQDLIQKCEAHSMRSEHGQENRQQKSTKKMKQDNSLEAVKPETIPTVDPKLVQVTADKAEIERRISAFIQRKQTDVDLLNKREFCSVLDVSDDNAGDTSCARTDAVFISRFGHTSHIKVTRGNDANISSEAQALGNVSGLRQPVCRPTTTAYTDITPGVEERLRSVERQLSFIPGKPVPHDVYDRLKCLEEKILFLEGLSPEYFRQNPMSSSSRSGPGSYRPTTETGLGSGDLPEDLSLDEIDARIRTLRQALRSNVT